MREWIARLRDWFQRDELDRELEEELKFHRQRLEQDATDADRGPEEARSVAARRLGNTTLIREAARERWSIPVLDHLQQDVRHALRGMRRSPGFTLTVVLTLALGIGANAAMFNVIDQLMFRPLAYLRDPGTVHRIYWRWTSSQGSVVTTMSTQYARYLDLERRTTSFSQLAAFSERDLAIGTGASARERRVGAVSASFFDFFDAPPALGRYFVAAEDVTPRGADVAVLSYDYWQSEFGARDVLGEALQVGEVRATIIGVAPPRFAGVGDSNPLAVYIPITTYAGNTGTGDAATYFTNYNWGWVHVLARRKAAVTREQADRDASEAFRWSWEAARADNPQNAPVEHANPHVVVSAVRPGAGPEPALEAKTALWVAFVAGIVLLIACANVMNLLVSRALTRHRETAMRLALGVSRYRLLTQAVTEGLVIAMLSGAVALLVAASAGAAIRGMLITSTLPAGSAFADQRTLAITFILTVLAGIAIGVVPSLLTRPRDLPRTLRGGVRGGVTDGAWLRSALLVVQGALSVVLLIGATLFVRSLDAVRAMPLGYDADRVLLVTRIIRGAEFHDSVQRPLRSTLLSRAQSLPGVESAAWVSSAPFVSTSSTALYVEGIDSVATLGDFTYQATTPDYFRTMGTRITRGRSFTTEHLAGSPDVAVVSESMARVLWPGQDAIGKCFRVRLATAPCTTVIGIAEDMVQNDISGVNRYHYYLSLDQFTRTWGNGMVLRLRGDPALQAEQIRRALQNAIAGSSYVTVRPLSSIVQDAQRSWRMGATMFVIFGLLALVVATIGLYGVIAYNVNQRMHELGVRVALGADRPAIVRLIVGQGVRLIIAGTALGFAAAIAASRWIQPLLFRQSATDPRVYAVIGVTMIVVAITASARPAFRAARADPNGALRAD